MPRTTSPRMYGYARVSTRDQRLDRQLEALEEFGVARSDVFADKASGKDFDRPEWARLMRALRAGDVLVVKSIDRLGRSYDEIIGQWRAITKELGAEVVVLDMPLLDTRESQGGVTGALISDIVLQLRRFVPERRISAGGSQVRCVKKYTFSFASLQHEISYPWPRSIGKFGKRQDNLGKGMYNCFCCQSVKTCTFARPSNEGARHSREGGARCPL